MGAKMKSQDKILVILVLAVLIIGIGFLAFGAIKSITGEAVKNFGFGYGENKIVNLGIKDNSGKSLDVKVNLLAEKDGLKDIEIIPKKSPIKRIIMYGADLNLQSGYGEEATDLKLDDVSEKKSGDFAEVYAIDPTEIEFENATVTVQATGNKLFKCKEFLILCKFKF